MSLNINYCRLCLQKIKESVIALSEDSKILALVTIFFPGLDTSLVINSKLCNECFNSVQFSNSVIETVKKNEQTILLNQNISEKSTCRLCLSNEKLDSAVCLLKNTNEGARHIEMAIIGLDFDIFREPVICNNCWQIVKSIYLFKKKCFATEKILKYYCATNKINSLDMKELELVQQFSENLDKEIFLCDKNAGNICTYLNNFSNNEHDVFEEAPEVVNILKFENDQSKEEDEIDIIEEKLCEFNESDEKIDMAADAVKLESIGTIEQTEITLNASAILLNKTENVMTGLSVKQEKILFCDKCDYQTKNRTQLNRHCLYHDNNAELLNCSKGIYSTTRKRDRQNHMRNHESLAKTHLSLKCEECPYETAEDVNITTCSNSLNNDMKTRHIKPETFKCQKCDYVTRKHTNLVRHMLIHEDNRKFPCNKCNYRGKSKSCLVKHMLVHQDNYNFQCHKCNYLTKRKYHLTRHMVIHQENCNFPCDNCSYQAKRKSDLDTHMLVHQDNYNFQCHKCNYQAKIKSHLVSHMLIHQDNYNFSCGKCDYQSKIKENLVRHMLIHQENYKFPCDTCNYQTKRKYDLQRHMLRH